ncbi:MAG: hypothetical protein K2H76_09375, partial [Muribaculaceae bacterium]|nr:hypothetical protein [Muribaculaceae bacterium]
YIINYAGASKERIEKVEIASRYREQHYQSRRVGKNRYVRGNPYYEYYINVILPSGKEKKLQIPYSAYSRMKSGMEINLSFSKGCLGADVINVKDIISDNPDLRVPAKRKRCRFVGTR